MEQRETESWLFCNTEILPSLTQQPPTLISPGLSPVELLPRKRVCVCVFVGVGRERVLPYLLTQSSPTEGKSHSVGVSVLFPWQNLFALCHSTINHAVGPPHRSKGLAMPPLATKTSTSLTLIYFSLCKEEEEVLTGSLGMVRRRCLRVCMCACSCMHPLTAKEKKRTSG